MRPFLVWAALSLVVFGWETASHADPSLLGPVVEVGEPAGGYVGRLTVTPNHARSGERVRVSGSGFGSGENLELVWRTVDGHWKADAGEYRGREYRPIAYRIATVNVNSAGGFSTEFVVPDDFGFSHDIVVQRGKRLLTQSNFNVDMSWEISPKNGPLGTPIDIVIKGIGWRELENSWDLVYDNQFVGWTSAVTTHGTARFSIPATGPLGTHVLKLIHGEFTFPYLNPQQNPRPDRPRFETSFTLTPGAAVLPPPVETQVQRRPPRGLAQQGKLRVEPAFGPIGTEIIVRTDGLAPKQTYRLAFGTMTGNRVGGGGFDEASRLVAETVASADGTVEFRFVAPDDLGGAHRLWIDGEGSAGDGVFTMVPSALPLTASSGPAGTPFSIHLKGVGWTETANIHTIVYDNNYIGYACGFNSQGDVEVYLNGVGAVGWHFIDVYPAIYKGQEVRPNNFRIPQLTFEKDHPGEDLPAFHFAFEVKPAADAAALR